MAKSEPVKAKAGCLQRLMFSCLLVIAALLAVAEVLVLLPQDLKDVEGRDPSSGKAPRDLKAVLKESVERGHEITLSEEEINRWLAAHLEMQQKGVLAGHVKRGRVLVRLGDGVAELVLVREVFGRPLTFSAFLQVEMGKEQGAPTKQLLLHGGPYAADVSGMMRGGRFGKLVVPQGYLHLLLPPLRSLADACQEEIHLAFEEMTDIRIEEGRLILNPRSREAARQGAPR